MPPGRSKTCFRRTGQSNIVGRVRGPTIPEAKASTFWAPADSSFNRLKRLRCHLKLAWWQFAGGLLAGVGFGLLSGAGLPMMVKTVLPVIFGNEIGADDHSPQKVVELSRWMFGDDYRRGLLLLSCLGLPVVFLLRGVFSFLNRYLMNRAGFIFLDALRRDVFNRLLELPLAFYQRHKSGDLASRLINDADQLKLLVINVSNDIIKQPLTLAAAVGFLLYVCINERSALFMVIAAVSVPLCVLPIRFTVRRIAKRSRLVARQSGELAAVVTEALQSPLEIQAYGLERQQSERFSQRVREIFRHSMKAIKYMAVGPPVIEFVSVCGLMAGLYLGAQSGMNFATFTALGFALYMTYEPVKKMSILHGIIKSRMASLERLEEILDAEDTVASPVAPRRLPADTGDLVFDNVSFSYPNCSGNGRAALTNVTVALRPAETVALVGASGAGKSTFALLIPRFFDPTEGRVTFCGMNLREVNKAELRSRIAFVPQMPALFNDTIAENIRMGRLGATDDEVRAAARKAFIADFIEGLPEGYQTAVGERGTALSGGQRQRVAIARAFLKDAPVLILDEATSALDSESEEMVRKALRELMKGRTTVMIAHRFSSISLARRVLVFEEGRVTGDGTPELLGRTHRVYQRMCELQRLA
jgi:ATP-binding cassette, subfamily B, bacterial MsbA